MAIVRHMLPAILLPVTATVFIPLVILYRSGSVGSGRGFPALDGFPFPLLATVYLVVGFWLLISTIRQFATEGHGTLAPWQPPTHLVVTGIYRFVRNPMISGVLFILLAEATYIGSKPLLIWFLVFFAINAAYIPLSEERGLEKRFGEEYLDYKRHVPRWVPRVRPWEPKDQSASWNQPRDEA